jgi:hypothetical protein
MNRSKRLVSSLIAAATLFLIGSGTASAALDTYSNKECTTDAYGTWCCFATYLNNNAWTFLHNDPNGDESPPFTNNTNTSYYVRSRAKCSSGGSWSYGANSVDGNDCSGSCERSYQSNVCPTGVVDSDCKISAQ